RLRTKEELQDDLERRGLSRPLLAVEQQQDLGRQEFGKEDRQKPDAQDKALLVRTEDHPAPAPEVDPPQNSPFQRVLEDLLLQCFLWTGPHFFALFEEHPIVPVSNPDDTPTIEADDSALACADVESTRELFVIAKSVDGDVLPALQRSGLHSLKDVTELRLGR